MSRTDRFALGILLAVFIFRLLVIAFVPCDLAGDEAYYWEWGKHLDWGYFSKPPGMGWLMGAAGWLGGDSVFGIRVFPLILATGAAVWLFALARRLFGERAGFLTLVLFLATPASSGLSFLSTVDAPLVFCWAGALYMFDRCLTGGFRSPGAVILLMILIAAGVLVKQMMLLFPVLALLFMGMESEHRRVLRRPAVYFALLLPIFALVPSLVWNRRHGWPTFHHTAEHFTSSGSGSALKALSRFGEFLGSQALLVTPVTFLLIVAVLVAAVRNWRSCGSVKRFLWLFSAPAIVVMTSMTIRQRVNPNWPAVYYLAGLVLASGWLAEAFEMSRFSFHPGKWRRAAVATAVALTAGAYLALILAASGLLDFGKLDPSRRLRGWSGLAEEVDRLRQSVPDPANTIVITRGHRYLASELTFYLEGKPRVYRFFKEGAVDSQHAFWPGPEQHLGSDAIILVEGRRARLPSAIRRRFDSWRELRTIPDPRRGADGPLLRAYFAENLRDWPPPPGLPRH